MKVTFSGVDETFRGLLRQTEKISETQMRLSLAAMLTLLKAETPKDTGFAASRWQLQGMFPRFRVENDASYIEYLNNGSSQQAPAFFIERIALLFGRPIGAITTVTPSSLG